ncbi:MAG: hypothetical protein IT464_05255, partial [Planctomycetes bacterium]|nr:hypothetical protein [Planctomycetota bacterium]
MRMLVCTTSVLLVLLFASVGNAQTVFEVGELNTNNSYPFNFGSGRYQVAYSASEMGVPSGSQLIEVRVGMAAPPTSMPTFNSFQLRVAHTTVGITALTGTFASNVTGTLNTCIGPSNFSPTSGVFNGVTYARFPLTTSFTYNATDNLILDWAYSSTTGTGWQMASSGTTIANRWRAYQSPGSAASTGTGSSAHGNWRIQLVFQTGPSLAVAAVAGTAQNVYANDTGSGGNGIVAGRFTVASNSQTGASLNS